MSYYIKSVQYEAKSPSQFIVQQTENPPVLSNLSKINIFVGANNSGKSRFMRGLAATTELMFTSVEFLEYSGIRRHFEQKFLGYISEHGFGDVNAYVQQYKQLRQFGMIKEQMTFSEDFLQFLEDVSGRDRVDSRQWNLPSPSDMANLQRFAREALESLTKLKFVVPPKAYKFRKIYFPILRGLRPFQGGDAYADRTQRDYSLRNPPTEVFTGLTLYQEIQRLLLGDLGKRKVIADFQNFLSSMFFEGEPVALIPKLDQDVLDIKLGDEKEFPIYNLGDGIQSIIILTFPLFKYQQDDVLAFFEEPELFMHPGMQRVLLNALTKFDRHQYFLTTHSNHFLDITLDVPNVSVYTFTKELKESEAVEKEAKFYVENVSNEDNRSLELLGVRNSSVFLTNCTIWVEGITDRRYLAHYLKLYQRQVVNEEVGKQFKEDLHYSFVEYGGGNITHWSFLDNESDSIVVDRLCGKLFLITDRDSGAGAKGERQEKLKAKLGERYYCLDCKEIENLLTPSVIAEIVLEYEGGSVEIKEFTQGSYKDKGLGKFIEESVLKGTRKRRGS
jgi:predicted ATPase